MDKAGYSEAASAQEPKKGKGKSGPPPTKGKGKAAANEKLCEEVHAACQFDDVSIFQRLLDDNSSLDVKILRTNRGLTPVHTAASNGSSNMLQLLLDGRASVEMTSRWRETPLHLAAAAGHVSAIHQLLGARAQLEATDSWTRTPLRVAVEQGAQAAAETLREAGAVDNVAGAVAPDSPDCIQRDQHDKLAAELVLLLKNREAKPVPEPEVKHMFKVERAASFSSNVSGAAASSTAPPPAPGLSKFVEYPADLNAVARLLEDSTVDPAGRDMFGLTALHKFSAWDRVDLIELLLPHLCPDDINAVGGDNGFSALHHAVSMGAIHSVAALLNDPRVARHTVDKSGRTASALASQMPGLENAATLLE